ncbi:hypothetical protein MSAN_02407900 [Mycena sanguinolenta]|uniref:Uncharacterized protein n=1 Tax=Mycena sanguinolenta TaxID=230812 RepID=A0A8H6X3A3_9AGAR|nr:hypothetical protein MSAN_02407900 [Mycena sanguinolenta]
MQRFWSPKNPESLVMDEIVNMSNAHSHLKTTATASRCAEDARTFSYSTFSLVFTLLSAPVSCTIWHDTYGSTNRIALGMQDMALAILRPTNTTTHIEAIRLPRVTSSTGIRLARLASTSRGEHVEILVASAFALTRLVFCGTPRVLELASRVRARPAPYAPPLAS